MSSEDLVVAAQDRIVGFAVLGINPIEDLLEEAFAKVEH
jgi:hypothetical protein